MADAYGTIIVGFSDVFSGDLAGLTETLNALRLDNAMSEFVIENGKIYLSGAAQYPTLVPERDKVYCLYIDGEEVTKHFDDMTDEDYEEDLEVIETEEIPLSEIADMLAEFIHTGHITLTCCSNEKNRSLISSYMLVDNEGKGQFVMIDHFAGLEANLTTETF